MDDPTQYSVSRLAKSSLPVFIPWQREAKRIMSCFDSTAIEASNGPWKQRTPFDQNSSSICETRLEIGAARDVAGHSGTHSFTSDHFSGNLGIAVGNSLVNVGVAASYDQKMQETVGASRASHNSRFRCGRIALVADPSLSVAAKTILRGDNGVERFAEIYGDYFVAGYMLGADAGSCLAASNSAKQEIKSVTTTVKVQVLWETYTNSTSSTEIHQTYDMDLTFLGYDTLDRTDISLQARAGEPTEHIRVAALSCTKKAEALQARLNDRIQALGTRDGASMNADQALQVIDAGVVAELILVPFKTLKEYSQSMWEGIRERTIQAAVDSSKERFQVVEGVRPATK